MLLETGQKQQYQQQQLRQRQCSKAKTSKSNKMAGQRLSHHSECEVRSRAAKYNLRPLRSSFFLGWVSLLRKQNGFN
jgi:hypothetical protein